MLTKQSIVQLLQTNDKAIARALVALAARQTAVYRLDDTGQPQRRSLVKVAVEDAG